MEELVNRYNLLQTLARLTRRPWRLKDAAAELKDSGHSADPQGKTTGEEEDREEKDEDEHVSSL